MHVLFSLHSFLAFAFFYSSPWLSLYELGAINAVGRQIFIVVGCTSTLFLSLLASEVQWGEEGGGVAQSIIPADILGENAKVW